jgi:hypothetical protein
MQYKTNYAFNWAKIITNKLTEKYTRGTKFFQKISGYSDSGLALILAKRPIEWSFTREIIKESDNFINNFIEIDPAFRSHLTLVGVLGHLYVKYDIKYPDLLLSERYLEPIIVKGSLQGGRRPNQRLLSMVTMFVIHEEWQT